MFHEFQLSMLILAFFNNKKIVECSKSSDFFQVQSKVQIIIYVRDLIIELKYVNMLLGVKLTSETTCINLKMTAHLHKRQ